MFRIPHFIDSKHMLEKMQVFC